MDFSELQRAVQRHVMHADTAVLPHVNESDKVPVAVRLGIYSNAYRMRLIEGLGANYPQLHSVLGDEAFGGLAMEYLESHPSMHFSIRWFGSELANYLLATRESQPWFAELARWEWALATAFDAADAAPVEMSVLAEIEPERWWTLRFDLHPSVQHLSLRTNAPAIFKALTTEVDPPQPEILPAEQGWVLWRQDLTTHFRSTAASEARSLQLVRADATFEELCEALCEWYAEEEVPTHAAGQLKSWIASGLITAVR